MKFTKMQGLGNDYVYVNGFTESVENKEEGVQLVHKSVILARAQAEAYIPFQAHCNLAANAIHNKGQRCSGQFRAVVIIVICLAAVFAFLYKAKRANGIDVPFIIKFAQAAPCFNHFIDKKAGWLVGIGAGLYMNIEIGRASCRERVLQVV